MEKHAPFAKGKQHPIRKVGEHTKKFKDIQPRHTHVNAQLVTFH